MDQVSETGKFPSKYWVIALVVLVMLTVGMTAYSISVARIPYGLYFVLWVWIAYRKGVKLQGKYSPDRVRNGK